MSDQTWWLANAEVRHASAPRSFFIPPRKHREHAIGRTVKLLFEFEPREVGGVLRDGERMWVDRIEGRPGGFYLGHLANEPRVLTELSYGDPLEFTPEQIIAIEYSPDELGYDPHATAAIDARLVKEDRPPKVLIFAQPPGANQSLWFAALDHQAPADQQLFTLGELTDRWPELAAVFSSGGGCWERADEPGTYRQTRFPSGL